MEMNKVWDFYSGISKIWLLVVALLLVSASSGIAISSGQPKLLAYMFLAFGLLAIVTISRRLKFWLLAVSIPLSLAQIPSLPIPHGFSICEIILLALTMDELLFTRNNKPLKLEIIIPLGLFTFAGLVTALKNGGINQWQTYCLVPLLWFFSKDP
jgi:hypothetical protein